MLAETVTPAPDYVLLLLPVIGAGIVVAGIAIVKHPDAVARFFRRAAEPMYGQRISAKIYTARNSKAAGVAYIAGGVLFMMIGTVLLVTKFL